MVDVIALSSIFLSLWVGSSQTKWGDTRAETLSVEEPYDFSFTPRSRRQIGWTLTICSVGISGSAFLSPTCIWQLRASQLFSYLLHCRKKEMPHAGWNLLFSLCLTGFISLPIMSQFCSLTPQTVLSSVRTWGSGRTVILHKRSLLSRVSDSLFQILWIKWLLYFFPETFIIQKMCFSSFQNYSPQPWRIRLSKVPC